jgi:hypothetical protein
MSEDKKTRDSKPRDVLFVCVAVIDSDLVVENIKIGTKVADEEAGENEILVEPLAAHLTTDDKGKTKMIATDEELRELALEAFSEKYDGETPEPENVRGPFYDRKGMALQQVKPGRRRRASIQVDIDAVRFGKKKAHAEFNDWVVTAQYVENEAECIANYNAEDGKAVMLHFKEPLAPGDKKKIVPNSRFVWEHDLKNIEVLGA